MTQFMTKSQETLKVLPEHDTMSGASDFSDIEDTKTLKHMVLFRFKQGTSEEAIDHVMQKILNLPNTIPQVMSVQAGPNLAESLDGGFTHGYLVELADLTAKDEFMEHNENADVMRDLIPILENIVKFDLF
jgi:hypothetical protein